MCNAMECDVMPHARQRRICCFAFDARARELRDGDELEDPLLDVLEPVVVRVEHLRT